MPTACFTGHRKINSQYYNRINPSPDWLSLKNYLNKVVTSLIKDHSVDHFITGLAIGVDMLGAESVAICRAFTPGPVKLTGAMPFPSQGSRWPEPTRNHWENTKGLCNELVSVSPDPYHPSKMQIRNEWMVDRSDYVIAIWNGIEKGGTWNCITYAKATGKPVLWIQQDGINWNNGWITGG